jgi:putative flippase GtrA
MSNLENTVLTGRNAQIVQFVKYCMVGVLNTLVTLVVIFVCNKLGVNEYVSNALGYICGVINSFLWNKSWVFKSKGGYSKEAIKFLIGFGICYALQFATLWVLNQTVLSDFKYDLYGYVITGYGIATLIGNVVYTIANYIYNRFITFK